MTKKEIIDLLNIGENREIEFKEATKKLPKSLWDTYSSFANTRGGIIVLGIKEDKENKNCIIDGVENVNNILKDFWNNINNKEKVSCNIINDDYVEKTQIDGKSIIIIKVPTANRITSSPDEMWAGNLWGFILNEYRENLVIKITYTNNIIHFYCKICNIFTINFFRKLILLC